MRRFALPLALAVSLAVAVPTRAEEQPKGPDTVLLKDGREIRGEVVGENDAMVSIRTGGVLPLLASDAYHRGHWKNRQRRRFASIYST